MTASRSIVLFRPGGFTIRPGTPRTMTDDRRSPEEDPEPPATGPDGEGRDSEREDAGTRPLVSDGGLDLGKLMDVLSHERRRYVVYYLQGSATDVVALDELVSTVGDWQTPPETEPTDDYLTDVERTLRHQHLPKLEAHGIVDFDPRTGTIRFWNDLPKRAWLEQARLEEVDAEAAGETALDAETVADALRPILEVAHDHDVDLERSFCCYTDRSYPDWDVTITRKKNS